MKKIIGYCRVSTDNQKEEGTIEIQEHALQEYAKENGYDLITIVAWDTETPSSRILFNI